MSLDTAYAGSVEDAEETANGPHGKSHHRRTNPKARAMRRHGKKYRVRQDHGAAATYKGRIKNSQLKAQGYRDKRNALGLDWDMNVSDRLCPDCYGPQYSSEAADYDTLCTPGYCGTRYGFWMPWM